MRSATPTTGTGVGSQSLPMHMGKYSFIHKVIDGITIVVNTVNVNFKSPAFTASVQVRLFNFTFLQKKIKVLIKINYIVDVTNPC